MNCGATDSNSSWGAEDTGGSETSEATLPPFPIADNAFLDDDIVEAIPIAAFAVFIAVQGKPALKGAPPVAIAFALLVFIIICPIVAADSAIISAFCSFKLPSAIPFKTPSPPIKAFNFAALASSTNLAFAIISSDDSLSLKAIASLYSLVKVTFSCLLACVNSSSAI